MSIAILEKVLVFLVTILPLVQIGYFEASKLVIFWVAGIVAVGVIILKRNKIRFKKSDLVFFLWLVSLTVSSIVGIHPWESIVGGSYRHQGVIFFFCFWLIYKAISVAPSHYLRWFGLSVIAESLLAILQKAVGFGLVNARVTGTLYEPNALAGFLAVGALAFLPLNIVLLLPALAIILTNSRIGLIAFVLGLVLGIKKKVITALFLLAIPLVTLVLWNVRPNSLIYFSEYRNTTWINTKINSVSDYFKYFRPEADTIEDRGVIWGIGIKMFLARPVLGYGAESQEQVYSSYFSSILLPLGDFAIERAHNILLDSLLTSGIIGTLTFVSWLCWVIRDKYSKKSYKQIVLIISWLVFSFLQPLGVVHWLLLILLTI